MSRPFFRLAAIFFALALPLSLSLSFVPKAHGESIEEVFQQAHKLYLEQDYTEALPLLREAAEGGHDMAQGILGEFYRDGKGVPQDYEQAVKWYQKAAEQGEPLSQNNLGIMYQEGKGVRQDSKQAAVWWRKAAEQGHLLAQSNLGALYAKGTGIEQDYKKAVKWMRKAAEHGSPEALNNLAIMYFNGYGIEKDVLTSYALLLIASKLGHDNAKKTESQLKEKLTEKQIDAGVKIAKAWVERIKGNKKQNP